MYTIIEKFELLAIYAELKPSVTWINFMEYWMNHVHTVFNGLAAVAVLLLFLSRKLYSVKKKKETKCAECTFKIWRYYRLERVRHIIAR